MDWPVCPKLYCCGESNSGRVLMTVPFEPRSTLVSKDAAPTLRAVVDLLAHHDFALEIDGYAPPGDGAAPERLATERAEHVRGALIKLGVDPTRLQAVPCGTTPGDSARVSFLVHRRDEGPCAP